MAGKGGKSKPSGHNARSRAKKGQGKGSGGEGDSDAEEKHNFWSVEQIIALIRAKRDQDAHMQGMGHAYARMKPREWKWQDVAQRLKNVGVYRNAEKCGKKWDNLMQQFKKVHHFQSPSGGADFFQLTSKERASRGFNFTMDRAVYDEIEGSTGMNHTIHPRNVADTGASGGVRPPSTSYVDSDSVADGEGGAGREDDEEGSTRASSQTTGTPDGSGKRKNTRQQTFEALTECMEKHGELMASTMESASKRQCSIQVRQCEALEAEVEVQRKHYAASDEWTAFSPRSCMPFARCCAVACSRRATLLTATVVVDHVTIYNARRLPSLSSANRLGAIRRRRPVITCRRSSSPPLPPSTSIRHSSSSTFQSFVVALTVIRHPVIRPCTHSRLFHSVFHSRRPAIIQPLRGVLVPKFCEPPTAIEGAFVGSAMSSRGGGRKKAALKQIVEGATPAKKGRHQAKRQRKGVQVVAAGSARDVVEEAGVEEEMTNDDDDFEDDDDEPLSRKARVGSAGGIRINEGGEGTPTARCGGGVAAANQPVFVNVARDVARDVARRDVAGRAKQGAASHETAQRVLAPVNRPRTPAADVAGGSQAPVEGGTSFWNDTQGSAVVRIIQEARAYLVAVARGVQPPAIRRSISLPHNSIPQHKIEDESELNAAKERALKVQTISLKAIHGWVFKSESRKRGYHMAYQYALNHAATDIARAMWSAEDWRSLVSPMLFRTTLNADMKLPLWFVGVNIVDRQAMDGGRVSYERLKGMAEAMRYLLTATMWIM
ncbi:hypothetical protein CBR_g6647 [Chara braunii]|uniref:Myb-like domain-containing protein n=1 Tax=Chara braunii TaxID=69332 RepID=A0A388KKF4_CHABU|nr:hypothetical protein CBR_g6647 [Chara braunii]|eukprot:GBG70519.1 hypothetical protein CBR_g6647 [Chara braunii]